MQFFAIQRHQYDTFQRFSLGPQVSMLNITFQLRFVRWLRVGNWWDIDQCVANALSRRHIWLLNKYLITELKYVQENES